SLRPVLDLGALVLARHDEPRGEVGDPDGGVGRVDTLAAGAGGTVDVDLEVLLVDPDLDLTGLGEHGDRHRRGVDPARRLRDGDALDAVDAALELEAAPHTLALDGEDDLLEPALPGLVFVEDLDPPALSLRVLHVHARQLRGDERGLVASGPRPNPAEHVLFRRRFLRPARAAAA